MNASGSEPTYLPLTNTSFAGLLLCCLGPANALEATLITRAIAIAVLVNMVKSPAGWSVTPHPVCVRIEDTGGGAVNQSEVSRRDTRPVAPIPVRWHMALKAEGFRDSGPPGNRRCLGPGYEVSKSG